jgi:hypothetical protein
MEAWMRDQVRGFPGCTRDEHRSFANELGLRIHDGTCNCGGVTCLRPERHGRAGFAEAGVGRPLFVEQAVIGPAKFKANSLAEGMFYRLILRVDYGMLVAKVEFNRCTNPRCPRPQRLYEEGRCPGDGCDSVYTQDGTEVIAQERLIVQGVYLPVLRWRCFHGPDEGHYYRQNLCYSEVVGNDPDVRYRVVHRQPPAHDQCPWCSCPYGNRQHSQRGTILWVREKLAPGSKTDQDTALLLDAYEEATRLWLRGLDEPTRDKLRAAIATDPAVSPDAREDPLAIVEWVLHQGQAVLGRAKVNQLKDCIGQELEIRGL